ncbi:MAG: response regulator [Lachnospiraceae bacterium]|nr:response regulator [Lachnospiraceae bacterium]
MKEDLGRNELFQTAHLMILIVYTLFSAILMIVSMLLGWENWALIPLAAGVAFSWALHIHQRIPEKMRLWTYSLLMMLTAFFYGIHATSTYDLAVAMCAILLIFILTGIPALINLGMITYYITFTYDIVAYVKSGGEVDSLFVSRTLMHLVVMYLIGYVAKIIMRTWNQVLQRTDERISVLTQATETMNDFLVNMSHEIRTPVNAVMGLSRVCIEKEKDEGIREDMLAVETAGKRVAEQISDILDYSEINMAHLVVNEEDYMLSSVLNDLVAQVRQVKPENLELVIDVDPVLPAVLHGDSGKLKKILWHLIVNGLKYTKEGGVYVRLYSIEEDYGINLCIDVTDTGIGMTAREIERVYEGFYQANSGRTRSSNGLGLGMSIVHGFVTSMKGFITLESDPGQGTTVRISIPQKVVDHSVCMKAKNNEKLILGTYLRFEKFSNPNVREFYNAMIRDIVTGLKVQMHRVETIAKLQKLVDTVKMTHLFVGDVEYEANREYLEELAKKLLVVVVANEDFVPPQGSHVRVMRKPFYCFPVINVLNSDIHTKEAKEGALRCEGVRALVVDDEPMNLMVAKGIFARYGMEVTCAESGKEAIELAKDQVFDIVFMDHMMPEMDGVEAMKRLRTETGRRDLPVVALTANAVSTAKEMFISEGFDGFVSKPVEMEELESVLKKALPKSMISYERPKTREEKIRVPKMLGIEREKATDWAAEEKPVSFSGDQMSGGEITAKDQLLRFYGIDVEKGLHYSQDDRQFYETLLKEFYSDSEKKRVSLSLCIDKQDMKNYSITIHALKSTAKMIGATDLSEQARLLEEAAKNEDVSSVINHHATVMERYRHTTEGIAAYLGITGDARNDTSGDVDDGAGGATASQQDAGIFEFMPEDDK